ncbi:hypothetical protein N7457_008575 [Penicillium paradoxum]|uniref:uncharacterized protein n=1 Tax=Penicillium paradoxum TaxID=176176 RepID=UPI0025473CAC|nr:uncharacterized protein N7457_008575 [Penicillium paradoxum]KAJ5773679.1 hypothetical protein N7457_008575 [Penicillium paradoxum]
MEPQTPARSGPCTSAHSRVQGSTRKKSCRKCVQAKARCDLGNPKCKRCTVRSIICEYPSRIESNNGLSRENEQSYANFMPANSIYDAGSLDSTWPPELAAGIGNPSRHQAHSAIPNSERVYLDPSLDLDFQHNDLVAMTDAEEIRDRWLRPYISDSTGQEPKQLNAHTIQYLTCVLKSYVRNLLDSIAPPFLHPLQLAAIHPPVLACCFTLVRMWLTRIPGSEPLILGTIHGEMKKITDQVEDSPSIYPIPKSNTRQQTFGNDFDGLCSFQAYLIYFMALHFFPAANTIEEAHPAENQTQINMQEIAFRSAKTGLTCRTEQCKARPRWESWIVASAKRRTLFTMYLFTNVYNTQVGLPNFVAEELRGVMVPESKILWRASSRTDWEREYNRHLSRWEDGMLEISELWKSSDTGTDAQRERIERWLQSADEFGVMLFAVCAHIHGC